jgi:hypothetical protein
MQRVGALKKLVDYRLSVISYAPGNSDGQIISLVCLLLFNNRKPLSIGSYLNKLNTAPLA